MHFSNLVDTITACSVYSFSNDNRDFLIKVHIIPKVKEALEFELPNGWAYLENLEVEVVTDDYLTIDTPIHSWYKIYKESVGEVDVDDEETLDHMYLILKYCILYKYGGYFVEKNVISLKSVQRTENFESFYFYHANQIKNAVSHLSKGHDYTYNILLNASYTYGVFLSRQRRHAYSAITFNSSNLTKIALMPTRHYYPIDFSETALLYLPEADINKVLCRFLDAQTFYVWSEHFFTKHMKDTGRNILQVIIEKKCPILFL